MNSQERSPSALITTTFKRKLAWTLCIIFLIIQLIVFIVIYHALTSEQIPEVRPFFIFILCYSICGVIVGTVAVKVLNEQVATWLKYRRFFQSACIAYTSLHLYRLIILVVRLVKIKYFDQTGSEGQVTEDILLNIAYDVPIIGFLFLMMKLYHSSQYRRISNNSMFIQMSRV